MKVIAEFDDPVIARKILEHLTLPADEPVGLTRATVLAAHEALGR